MKYITLNDFKKLTGVECVNFPPANEANKNIRGISIDSRSLKGNQVFWALKGPKYDGHNFILDAIKRGAAGIVVNRSKANRAIGMGAPIFIVKDSLQALQKMAALHRRKFRIPIIGITGTNGKTTTKEMIAWLLQSRMNVHRTWGNLNNHIGVPMTLLSLNSEHDYSIIELGTNHPGEISMLSNIVKPTAGLITNIARGHLQFFSNIEGVAREKTELFNSLTPKNTVFLNLDDPRLATYPLEGRKSCAFSLRGDPRADVRGKFIKLNKDGMGIWELNGGTRIVMRVPGIHNVNNALAASAVALCSGFGENEIRDGLEAFTSYDKRMQVVKSGKVTILNDSYNANPDSYQAALQTLEHIATQNKSRKIVVFGDMLELGLKSESYHQELFFNLLDYNIDAVFTLGEESKVAAELLLERGYENIFTFSSHEQLGNKLKSFIKPRDIVLIKGSRGMMMEKVLAFL